jgi:hypothetical protein
MNDASSLERLLATDPADVGCNRTFELLELYVEVGLGGQDPQARLPGVAAHLRSCDACRADYQGLLAVADVPDG